MEAERGPIALEKHISQGGKTMWKNSTGTKSNSIKYATNAYSINTPQIYVGNKELSNHNSIKIWNRSNSFKIFFVLFPPFHLGQNHNL